MEGSVNVSPGNAIVIVTSSFSCRSFASRLLWDELVYLYFSAGKEAQGVFLLDSVWETGSARTGARFVSHYKGDFRYNDFNILNTMWNSCNYTQWKKCLHYNFWKSGIDERSNLSSRANNSLFVETDLWNSSRYTAIFPREKPGSTEKKRARARNDISGIFFFQTHLAFIPGARNAQYISRRIIYWHTFTSTVSRYTLFVFYYLSPSKFCALFSKTLQLITTTNTTRPSSSFSASQNLTPTLLLFPCTPPPLSPVPVHPLAPIRSIVPHDPATDCLRSILDTSSVFEVATSTLSACSSKKPGRQDISRISGSDSNDSSPIATAGGFKASFRREMKNEGRSVDVRFSACENLPDVTLPSPSFGLFVSRFFLRLKRTQQNFCKQGILMFVKVKHERIQRSETPAIRSHFLRIVDSICWYTNDVHGRNTIRAWSAYRIYYISFIPHNFKLI